MYRRSWEMQGNSLKKLRPSIKWVTFQAGPNLIHSDSGAFGRGTILSVSVVCSVPICRALQKYTWFCKGDILGLFYRRVKVRQGGLVFLPPRSLAGWYRCVMFAGAPRDPCYFNGELLCRFYAVVQAEIEGWETNRNTDVILSLKMSPTFFLQLKQRKTKFQAHLATL